MFFQEKIVCTICQTRMINVLRFQSFLVLHHHNTTEQSLLKLQFWMDEIVVFNAKTDSTPSNIPTLKGKFISKNIAQYIVATDANH
jgi:hypothetical protein